MQGNSASQYNLTETVNKYCQIALSSYNVTKKELYCKFEKRHTDMFIGLEPKIKTIKGVEQKLFNAVNKNFRIRGLQTDLSNSILTYTDVNLIPNFGDTYVIFPFDGFDFTWSPMVSDIRSINLDFDDPNSFNLKQLAGYTNRNFSMAMRNGYEILIRGKYLAVALDNLTYEDQ